MQSITEINIKFKARERRGNGKEEKREKRKWEGETKKGNEKERKRKGGRIRGT